MTSTIELQDVKLWVTYEITYVKGTHAMKSIDIEEVTAFQKCNISPLLDNYRTTEQIWDDIKLKIATL